MALQASGAISFSDLQTEVGGSNPISMSEYVDNGEYLPDIAYSNWYTPLTGTFSSNAKSSESNMNLSDYYGIAPSTQWTYDDSPVKSGYSSSNSTTFNINTYVSNLSSGKQFAVCTDFHPSTSWQHGEKPTLVCTYGTSASLTVSQMWDKQWRLQISYDGDATVTIGGYYAYASTGYPNGGAYLRAVARIS